MANFGAVGTVAILTEADSVGPVKHLRVSVVGDSAYVAGGSVGFLKALRTLMGNRVNVIHSEGSGTNKLGATPEEFEYTPRGSLIDIDAAAVVPGTDLITSKTAHGLSSGNAVRFFKKAPHNANLPDPIMPTGLAEDTIYYVIASGLTSTAFKVSATAGGSALDITAAGLGLIQVQSEDMLLVRKATDGTEEVTADQSASTYKLKVTAY